jgi:hypothetical protein
MPDRFIDNFTPGSGGDGLSWANAELTAAEVDAVDTAGDRWLFDYRHSESTAGAVTLTVAGTLAAPSQLLSVTQTGAAGISSLTAGAIIATTGASNIAVLNSVYVYGITFNVGSGVANASFVPGVSGTANAVQTYDSCNFDLVASGSGCRVCTLSTATLNVRPNRLVWNNCGVRFAAAGQGIAHIQGGFEWRGGSVLSGGTSPTVLFPDGGGTNGRTNTALLDGVDLSNCAAGVNLVGVGTTHRAFTLRNCKLPSSWSGSLTSGTLSILDRIVMLNCASGDINYALWVEDYAGSIKHETTLVKTGGASDGTTSLSWVMASSADAEYPAVVLRSPEIQKWNETTGSAITVTVDFLHDSVTNLQDDEIWLEVEYLGTSGFPLALFADDAAADVVATPADQATSAATWTTTGMANPNEQKLSVTFTPQEKGLIIARVCVGLASKTVYVDPVLQVS